MTVLVYAWYSYSDYIAPARWFVVMNYLVHSLMYTYYAMKVRQNCIRACLSHIVVLSRKKHVLRGSLLRTRCYKKNRDLLCKED